MHTFRNCETEAKSTGISAANRVPAVEPVKDPVARGPRRTGKSTALCLRAIEYRSEALTVNIVITPSTTASVVTRLIVEGVARELYPEIYEEFISGIVVSSLAGGGFDRYLVDEITMVPNDVVRQIEKIHGAVASI